MLKNFVTMLNLVASAPDSVADPCSTFCLNNDVFCNKKSSCDGENVKHFCVKFKQRTEIKIKQKNNNKSTI